MHPEADLWPAMPVGPGCDAKASLDAIGPALVALLRVAREITAHGTPTQLRQYHHHMPQLVQAVRAQRLHGSGFVMHMLTVALKQRLRDARALSLSEAALLATWPSLWITEVLGCGESGLPPHSGSAVLDCLQGLDWFPVLSAPLAQRLQRWLAQDRARYAAVLCSAEAWVDAEPMPLLQVDFRAVGGHAPQDHAIAHALPTPLLL